MFIIKTLIEVSLEDICDPGTPPNMNGTSVFSPGEIFIMY